MTSLTVGPAIACVLIVALLAFWLFAPTKWVSTQLSTVGHAIQWVVAKFVGLFHKKAPSPAPIVSAVKPAETVPEVSILPVDPPKFPNGVVVEPVVEVAPPTETK